VMVYNQKARQWIRHLQKAFHLLKLDPTKADDQETARHLLQELAAHSTPIKTRLKALGPSTMQNSSRFADTFFHTHETNHDLASWLQLFGQAGLSNLAVFDRYAELDDLPNPMWQAPTAAQLIERAADYRFENNLEIYLYRPSKSQTQATLQRHTQSDQKSPAWSLLRRYLSLPPRAWFQYEETRQLSFRLQHSLWREHLCFTHGYPSTVDKLMTKLEVPTRQRLARIGVVLPGQIQSQELAAEMLQPMCSAMDATNYGDPVNLRGSALSRLIIDLLQERNIYSDRRFHSVIGRLSAAQS